jgi:eukaryotic-like serine/threonine-protein kinase
VSRENLLGQTLAGYTLRQLVGEGGTAVVYRAESDAGQTVAFKVLREKLRRDKTAIARFVREAQFGQQVLHPNVVATIATGEENGLRYLVIEWASGELLEGYARRNAPLPADEVSGIITQIASAVDAAHKAGIIHRDLKPENIMYDPASRQAKLLDFGIAAAADMSKDERLTRAGFFVGTLMYVAPEALSGELVTHAADQYSLATIAYFLLTGRHPYTPGSPRELFTQLLSQPPIPLNEARENLTFPPQVQSTIMRALSRKPEDRFESVNAFAQALATALSIPHVPQRGLAARVRRLFSGGAGA